MEKIIVPTQYDLPLDRFYIVAVTLNTFKGRRHVDVQVFRPNGSDEEMEALRATESHQKKLAGAAKRRQKQQKAYEAEFYFSIRHWLNFHPDYDELAHRLAKAVTLHAIPVGSGTVARTTRIPVEERAAKAVIAWMRHQTTAYDRLNIARIKGERRRVRQLLAQTSQQVLSRYRQGQAQLAPSKDQDRAHTLSR